MNQPSLYVLKCRQSRQNYIYVVMYVRMRSEACKNLFQHLQCFCLCAVFLALQIFGEAFFFSFSFFDRSLCGILRMDAYVISLTSLAICSRFLQCSVLFYREKKTIIYLPCIYLLYLTVYFNLGQLLYNEISLLLKKYLLISINHSYYDFLHYQNYQQNVLRMY